VGPFPADGNLHQVPLDGKLQIETMDLYKLSAAVPQIKAALPKELDLSGAVKIKDLNFKGTLQNLSLNGVLDASDGAIRFGKSFQKPSGIPLTVSTEAQFSNGTVSLRPSEIKLHTLELATKGDVTLGDGTGLNLTVISKPASLDGWEKIIPAIANYRLSGKTEVRATIRGKFGQGAIPEIQGVMNLAGVSAKPPQFPKAVKNLTATIDFTGRKANIKDTTLILGESRIRLSAVIERFSPLTLTYKMSTPEIWPADFQAALPDDRKGDVIRNLTSEGQIAKQDSGMAVQAKVLSTQGTLYKIGYKNLDANLSLANKIANIRNLRVNALSGNLQADGEYGFNTPVPRFSLASKVQGIDIKELYAALSPKAERDIRGRLNADMKISGSGSTWEEMKPTLRGQGEGEVLQGALLNFNVPENVLGGITGMPGLANMINPKLRSKYPATFEAKDTEFKEMKALFDVADGRVNVKTLRIAAADYFTQGSGWVDFDRRVDFRSVLTFSQPMSADIGQSAREVKYLFNNQNQLEIPYVVTGQLPRVKVRPDANYLGRMVQRGLLGKGAEELQQRSLGNKEPKTDEPASGDSQKRKKSSTEDRIRKGIEGLFK
jgi:AsmA-like C-terminal region